MAKKKFDEFKQGIFKPLNKLKCLNKNDIVYRSSLEFKMMRILDANPNIIEWHSEGTVVPYMKPGPVTKPARYFVDFYFKIKIENVEKKYLVEIKPYRQSKPPEKHGNKKMSTILYENIQYAINKAKWEAADIYAKQRGMQFLVITEKNIDQLTSSSK